MLRFIRPSVGLRSMGRRWFSQIHPTPCGLHVDRSLPPNFNKILIANRGEIAVRVIRTARELGVKTVAVYSDADADAMHVTMADEAYHLGPPAAAESYLLSDKILEICKASGAQAVHPGYGFLSENAEFADACKAAGVTFIGPPADAIRSMGSKSASKHIMIAANVPVVPGYHEDDQALSTLKAKAQEVGFPLMIKAVLGGGGKGMRIVRNEGEFEDMLDAAKRESMKSFKDDRVLLERYIERPRHIEFQVFADTHGNAVHLYERDCSVQRRHQKVLEEAPAPGMSDELRKAMGEAAVNAAKAVGYEGAGTVEFIFDAETDDYFFMEMNTRLQVEHPVTEMVMKRDLVQWQLHVAAGHKIPAEQSELKATGHALEARVYAENPQNDFLPATGMLTYLQPPKIAHDCRVESGVRQGDEVSIYYDPMISKLIVSAADRESCLRRMSLALDDYRIVGPPTNISFLKRCVDHAAFQKGQVETGFIQDYLEALNPKEGLLAPTTEATAAACLALLLEEAEAVEDVAHPEDEYSPWLASSNFRMNVKESRTVRFGLEGADDVTVSIVHLPDHAYLLQFEDGRTVRVSGDVHGEEGDASAEGLLELTVGGSTFKARVLEDDNVLNVYIDGVCTKFTVPSVEYGASGAGKGGDGCVAPMAGKVVKVMAEAGASIALGEPLMIMEAMKMEHVIKAPRAGVVKQINYGVADFVEGGAVVISFEPEAEAEE